MRCSKCFTEEIFLVRYVYPWMEEEWGLCGICNRVFDDQFSVLMEFLKSDFGGFPINSVNRNMINARKRRAIGGSPWIKEKESSTSV